MGFLSFIPGIFKLRLLLDPRLSICRVGDRDEHLFLVLVAPGG